MSDLRNTLFNLNNLDINKLKIKWYELFNSAPPNYKRGLFIKELAYRIQSLSCCSGTSEEELKLNIRAVKSTIQNKNTRYSKNINLLPPGGSIIKKIYNDKQYIIKVINDKSFEYNGNLYKSLSSVAYVITGTRWNGFVFFGLKKQ